MNENESLTTELKDEMAAVLVGSGIVAPVLPPWFDDRIDEHNRADYWEPWAWRNHHDADPWWCYFGADELGQKMTGKELGGIEGDFLVFAHRGHGMNSYGLGLVARIGSLLIDQQILWGGGFLDTVKSTACVNAMTESWNKALPEFLLLSSQSEASDGSLVRVRFSDYRGWSGVDLVLPDGRSAPPAGASVPAGLADTVALAQRYLESIEEAVQAAMDRSEDDSTEPRAPGRGRGGPSRGRRRTRVSRFRNWLADRIWALG